MKLNQTKTEPSTRSVLSFDEDEVIEALKMLAKERGYIISENGKHFVQYPVAGQEKTLLIINADGSDFSIKN